MRIIKVIKIISNWVRIKSEKKRNFVVAARYGRAPYVRRTLLAKKIKRRVLKEAAGVCVLGQQFFNRAPYSRSWLHAWSRKASRWAGLRASADSNSCSTNSG